MARKREEIVEAGEKTRFKPGETGNPNGRPKGVPNAATRYMRFLQLEQQGKNPVTGETETFTLAELMDLRQIKRAIDGDLNAYKEILDRLEGKSVQKSEVDLNGNMAVASEMTPEKFEQLKKLLSKE